jgi:murein L,D-transpeptidase YcbB/YkuD
MFLLGLVSLVGAALLLGCASSDADREIALAIRKQVAEPSGWFQKRPTVDDDDVQPLVRRFYKGRKYFPAWTHIDGPTADARELLEAIDEAPQHGLSLEQYDYQRMRTAMEKPRPLGRGEPADLAALDVELTRNFLKLASHLSGGQVNPLQLPADWHVQPGKRDLIGVLVEAISKHRVAQALQSLAPKNPQYAGLRKALAEYRHVQEEGGWPEVPGGAALRRGSSGARVAALQKRLLASGDLGGLYVPGRFDASTQAAVNRFETRHGLEVNGVVGTDDLRELNLPVAHRIRQIEVNLERWRWLSDSLMQGRYVMVNIPDYSLRVVEAGRTVLAMRVVVGKDYSRTPMFTDEISYLVFNPVWNVPSSIATAEILGEVQRDPTYLERNKMRVFENETDAATELDPASIDWPSVSPDDFRYAIRQDPGPENPVGRLKFMCPNQFNVYLHDTPAGQLFAARERTFSHGCIRVEKAVELAAYLLRDEGFGVDRLAAEFETADNTSVRVPRPIPLHILYWTAFIDERGILQFRDDVYGFDHLLDRTLRKQRPDIKTQVRTAYTPTDLGS